MATVMVLDDDGDLLATIADVLRMVYFSNCLPLRSYAEMVTQSKAVLACDLAILDINLGPDQPSGLEAYRWLKANHFRGRVMFITGHAELHPLVAEAQRIGGTPLLRKPFVVDELGAALRS
jgi:FixJ family two-component response regulator